MNRHRLYGREKELEVLSKLSNKICKVNADAQICLVHGASGNGKTALCEQLQRQLQQQQSQQNDVVFIKGKFDQFQGYSSPYSAIVQAFESLGQSLLLELEKTTMHDQADILRLQEVLTHEGGILASLIPSFSQLIIPPNKQENENGQKTDLLEKPEQDYNKTAPERRLEVASERVAVGFRSFLRVVCTPARSLVLFVDDLQWCDASSLDILAAIVEDTAHIKNFLFLGGYRDENETNILSFLEQIREKNGQQQQVTDILVGPLDLDCVTSLISDDLTSNLSSSALSHTKQGEKKIDDNQLSQLAKMVYETTMGNPYFVLRYLGILKREGLILFRHETNDWAWDVQEIQDKATTKKASQQVHYFLTKQILALPPDVRRILKLAACLGYSVNIKLLETLDFMELASQQQQFTQHLIPGSSSSAQLENHESLFQGAIDKAIAENLVQTSGTMCSFTHDRVEQCAYELIPIEDMTCEKLHLRIGRRLFKLYKETKDSQFLFLAADQCNRGSIAILKDEEERMDTISINLEASQAARAKSGASMVALFLDKAIDLIRPEDWKTSMYNTALEVYCLSAEVESARGKFDHSIGRVDVILLNSKCPQDKVRAIAVTAQAHGARQEYSAALSEMKKALAILGVNMPASGKTRLMIEIYRLKRSLHNKTESDFIGLEQMTDKRMLLAMKILQMCVIWGWNADIYFGSLSYLSMVRISMAYGRCFLTPFALAGFGNVLVLGGDVAKGYWFGRVALRLDEGKEAFPATTMVVHCYLSHLRNPAWASLETLLSAYRVSIETGDLYLGTICICVYHWVYKFCGLPLDPFSKDLRNYLAELRLCQQDYLLAFLLPDLQLALNLFGSSSDPVTISWQVIERSHSFVYKWAKPEEHPAELNRLYTQLFNAIVLENVDAVKETMVCILARKKAFRRFDGSHIANQFFAFWDGLACFVLLRGKWSRSLSRRANDSITVLTRLSKAGSINCIGMLELLKAEKKSFSIPLSQEVDKFLYDDAISQLLRTGFIHYGAVANERAGDFMFRRNDSYWAEQYLSRSAALYRQWGALVKVEQLQMKYPFLVHSEHQFASPEVTVHGRKRYSHVVDSLRHVSGEMSLEETLEAVSSS